MTQEKPPPGWPWPSSFAGNQPTVILHTHDGVVREIVSDRPISVIELESGLAQPSAKNIPELQSFGRRMNVDAVNPELCKAIDEKLRQLGIQA